MQKQRNSRRLLDVLKGQFGILGGAGGSSYDLSSRAWWRGVTWRFIARSPARGDALRCSLEPGLDVSPPLEASVRALDDRSGPGITFESPKPRALPGERYGAGASPDERDHLVGLPGRDLPAYGRNPTMPLWSWHAGGFLYVVNQAEAVHPQPLHAWNDPRAGVGGPYPGDRSADSAGQAALRQHREVPALVYAVVLRFQELAGADRGGLSPGSVPAGCLPLPAIAHHRKRCSGRALPRDIL